MIDFASAFVCFLFGGLIAVQDAETSWIDDWLLWAFVGCGALAAGMRLGDAGLIAVLPMALIPWVVAFVAHRFGFMGDADPLAVLGYGLWLPYYFGAPTFPVPLATVGLVLGFVSLFLFEGLGKEKRFLPHLWFGMLMAVVAKAAVG